MNVTRVLNREPFISKMAEKKKKKSKKIKKENELKVEIKNETL